MPEELQDYKINQISNSLTRIEKRVKDIERNDLKHIYSRLGKVEGKIVVLIGIATATFAGIGVLIINTFI